MKQKKQESLYNTSAGFFFSLDVCSPCSASVVRFLWMYRACLVKEFETMYAHWLLFHTGASGHKDHQDAEVHKVTKSTVNICTQATCLTSQMHPAYI